MALHDQLEALFDRLAPEVAKAFREAVQDVTDNVILRQVIEAVERNDIEGAFRALGFAEASFNGFLASIQSVFNSAGIATMAALPSYATGADGIKTKLRFNVRDPLAEQWLRDQSSGLITGIESDVRNAVRNTMQTGIAEGRNPRNVALDIVGRIDPQTGHREGGVVGLGEREELWSRNTRHKLITLDPSYFDMALRDKRFDATVKAAIDGGRALPAEAVDKLVDRYRVNALRHRGETIARTETLAALNKSEWLSIKQVIEQGNLTSEAVTKIWDDAGDNRVRHSHEQMDGQRRALDEPFVSPLSGARLMHPGDTSLGASGKEVIGCRCRVRYEVDWFAGVK